MLQPGETVKLKISGNGSVRDLSVKLGELPASKEEAQNQKEGASQEALEGVSVENLDADTAKELGLPASTKAWLSRISTRPAPRRIPGCAKVT